MKTVLGLKVGNFQKSSLTNCDKILNFADFEKGVTHPLCTIEHFRLERRSC